MSKRSIRTRREVEWIKDHLSEGLVIFSFKDSRDSLSIQQFKKELFKKNLEIIQIRKESLRRNNFEFEESTLFVSKNINSFLEKGPFKPLKLLNNNGSFEIKGNLDPSIEKAAVLLSSLSTVMYITLYNCIIIKLSKEHL